MFEMTCKTPIFVTLMTGSGLLVTLPRWVVLPGLLTEII